MCTLYLPSLLYAVISLLFNCPQSARAVVTDTLSLTSPPVNPNCELGLRDRTMPRTAVAPPRAAGTQQSLPSIKCYDHNQAEYLGATRATNNTGELGAVCHALMGARELARAGEVRGSAHILSDSQIAGCTTIGAWASRKCKALVERNRRTLAALRAQPTARQCGSGTSGHMPATE